MKYKKIILTALISAIVAVNGLTVFWLVRGGEKSSNKVVEQTTAEIFGQPDKIITICDGEINYVMNKEYDDILTLAEKSHKYVEIFTDVGSFSGDDELLLEFIYDVPHHFSHGGLEYDTTNIKINLYNGNGDMLIQTDGSDVCLGYLNITAEFIDAVK